MRRFDTKLNSYKGRESKFSVSLLKGPFLYIMRWAGLPFMVMGPSMLGKGVETSPAATQPGLVCAQTMPRLPRVCLRQAELFQKSHDKQT